MKKITFLCCFIATLSVYAQNYFVTTWNTEANDLNSVEIILPIVEGTYDVDTNKDGTFDMENLTGTTTITFPSKGTHTIAVRPNADNNTTNQLRINFLNSGGEKKLTSIDNWGSIVWTSMENAFNSCSNMTISDTAGVPNLTRVTSTSYMFYKAMNLDSDLSTWDVSKVTSMKSMFSGATLFTGNLSTWNVSKVTDMAAMFANSNYFDSDLSAWNVSQVTDMLSMFHNAFRFTSNLSTWDVSMVTDMRRMLNTAIGFSPQDYDALLTGWSNLPSLQPNVGFGAPPVTYCAGKGGRDILEFTYGWRIIGDIDGGCSATSVDEEFLSNTKIYPNPTNSKITIESSFKIDKLELYNVLGAKIFSVSKTNALDLTSLKQGIYISKVFSADRVVSKKIIKH